MTDQAPVGEARFPRPPLWLTVSLTALILLTGFLFFETSAAAVLFGGVAKLLAVCTTGVLRWSGYDLIRTGTEIRDTVTGRAVLVSSACDGSGLLLSFIAAAAWLRPRGVRLERLASALTLAIATILLFNLLRILVLFMSAGMPAALQAEHLFIAPLLSVPLVATLALYSRRLHLRDVFGSVTWWLIAATGAALAWYAIAERVSCLTTVPLANALLWAWPGVLTQSISCMEPQATVTTSAVLSIRPTTFVTAPFFPADFTLATPLLAASLSGRSSGRTFIRGIVVSLLLFGAATAIAAITASHDAAAAAQATASISDGFVQSYRPLPAAVLGFLKATQNSLVHFNLFILPIALAGLYPERPTPVPAASPRPKRPRGSRSRPTGR